MNLIIAGGTGFIGAFLARRLVNQNHSVAILSRRVWSSGADQGIEYLSMAQERRKELIKAVEKADCIVNLAGEPIAAKRWTTLNKETIVQSRVRTTSFLVELMGLAARKPECLVSASAVGFYGSRGNEELDEKSHIGLGFLADTCRRWEEEAQKAGRLGVRVVIMRVGMVLGLGGGALAKMLPCFRFFLGGPLGNGQQWVSWIHEGDLSRLTQWAAENRSVTGIVNAVSPSPVRMKEFAWLLGRSLHRPAFLPIPGFVLSFFLGEMADVLLASQKVVPRRALENGFKFDYEHLEPALKNLLQG